MAKTDLSGEWAFCLDAEKKGVEGSYYNRIFTDTIQLPSTVSEAKKGIPSKEVNTGYLTDPYFFEGFTWYSKSLDFADTAGKELFLVLERTRISHVWIDDRYAGSNNSLCTSHKYCITPFISDKQHRVTVMVDNTSYPVKGGHMTSPDTQTNWNGITGAIYLETRNQTYLDGVKIYPDAGNRLIRVKVTLHGCPRHTIRVFVSDKEGKLPREDELPKEGKLPESRIELYEGENSFTYQMDERAILWSEHSPKLYLLHMDEYEFSFGLRDFKAVGNYFEINGARTFLRGKHDGLLFPITGYAPTDTESWLKVLETARQYGMNHYRFHTCCPPKAAFEAADLLGMYMEPELPFWGTVTAEGEENHDSAAQDYLVQEGYRILDEFGNHPSFVMMSLGNELWGSKARLDEILEGYRKYDDRPLYTQGSNNFQFMPCILENEDFFCGVRFSRDRLFRGSYAMCDAPQGHIQTLPPDTCHSYDDMIRPSRIEGEAAESGEVTIQYGTGTKTVRMDASEEIIPKVPVVSHEIGQYAMYPDFSEIHKYTGVLKPRNLECFQERLEEKGMLSKAEMFFRASGRFAAECYKAEIETAMRSRELAGFQVLDLQDFSGQGTALVGILNAFMESKGVMSASEWRTFCGDTVLLGELPKLVFAAGEMISMGVKLSCFHPAPVLEPELELTLWEDRKMVFREQRQISGEFLNGVYSLGTVEIKLPEGDRPKKLVLHMELAGTEIKNSYDIWVFPVCREREIPEEVVITGSLTEACDHLLQGKKVLFFPEHLTEENSIEGTYCTDFWCYPMFRSISESVNKPVPIGTHGLLIEAEHEIFREFPTEYHSTPQWYDFVSGSRAVILDGMEIQPMVWTIDNFERNHKLGNIFEVKAGEGMLLVCTCNTRKRRDSLSLSWLENSLVKYIGSEHFNPCTQISVDELKRIMNGIA